MTQKADKNSMFTRKSALHILYGLMMVTLINCSKNSLQTGTSYNVLSQSDFYLNSNTQYRVFNIEGTKDRFVTELVPQGGVLTAPANLTKGDFGIRTDSSIPQPLNLVVRAYAKSHQAPDFYFESLVLAPNIELSNVTTALSWYMRFAIQPQPDLSQNTFKRLVTSVELLCSDCRKKTNSEVLKLIEQNAEVLASVKKFIQIDNPQTAFTFNRWASPGPLYAWSNVNLTLDKVATKTAKESEKINLELILVDPDRSESEIRPSSWIHTRPNSSTEVNSGSILEMTFSFEDKGQHSFRAVVNEVATDYRFDFLVDNMNRNPYCDLPLTVTVYANRLSSFDLSTVCRDPDNDSSTINFSLSSGPVNLSISDIGRVQWSAPQAADGLDYTVPLKFIVADSERGFFETEATVRVLKDQVPTFTATPTLLNLVEGADSSFTFSVTDPEGDPVKLSAVGLSPIQSGYPAGAGDLARITSTRTGNVTQFTFTFMPSYFQTIGADGTIDLRFAVKYDDSGGVLNGTVTLATLDLRFSVANQDDPPTWLSTPQELALSEGVDVGSIAMATASDSMPNPTSVTYSIESVGGVYCNHPDLTVSNIGGIATLNGKLAYASYSACDFRLKATDTIGLFSYSDVFSIQITDVNQPLTLLPGAPTLYNDIYERTLYLFPVNTIFEDLDNDQNDPYELYSHACNYYTDASYSTALGTCASQGVAFTMGINALYLAINPSSTASGTYYTEIIFTDKGGSTVNYRFTMIINQAAAPMDLDTIVAGSSNSAITVAENSTTQFILRASPASVDAIDDYNFVVANPACSKIGGGLCPNGMLAALGSLSGHGATDLNFRLTPDYNAGNAALPNSAASYLVSFNIQKSDDPTLRTDYTFQINVENSNRLPTALSVTAPAFGCTGDTSNSLTSKFQVCIDLSKDKKTGNSWQKNYVVNMGVVDPDSTNDLYTYSLVSESSPGSFTNNSWSFKIPGCFNSGTSTIYRSYDVQVADGRGGTLSRTIELKIIKASAIAGCQ